MKDLPETFWAWLAGFIDGDGCLNIYQDKQGYYLCKLCIHQKDRLILDYIIDKLGVGSISSHPSGFDKNSLMHQLTFGSRVSREITRSCLPYLILKKKKAHKLLGLKKKIRIDKIEFRDEFSQALGWYIDGLSCKAIGIKLGLKPATINYWLRSQGYIRNLSQAQKLRRQRERSIESSKMLGA